MNKPIEDYGMIGNCRSCALVSDEASIDFMCLPDFDSPAQLCALLDSEKGGFFQIQPVGFFKSHQRYLSQSNMLETYFFNPDGNVSVIDFMPINKKQEAKGDIPEYGTKLVRLVKSIRGDHHIKLTLKLTPDFAQQSIEFREKKDIIIISDNKYKYILYKKHHKVKLTGNLISITFHLNEGEQEFFSLKLLNKNDQIREFDYQDLNAKLAQSYFETMEYWRWWISKCKYHGAYSDQVVRSALTLKMLTYMPTGAIVASPTTSLPEKIGGELNWDYRYTWLRDASFSVYAFLGLGYVKEAERFVNWMEKVCLKEGSQLKIMYGIRGEEELTENQLSHLSGYNYSSPVRTGNGAANQKQFDIFGEVLTTLILYVNAGGTITEPMKMFIKQLVDYCCIHWKEKDEGIWEPRTGPKHNTYSKLMCWAGVDRGIKLVKKLNIKNVDISFWEETARQIKEDILKHGYNKKVGAFVAYYGSNILDASTLNIPIVGLLPANDPRVRSTLDKVMRKLVVDWFVLRTSDTENKLQEGEGAFFLTTFWLIDCLLLLGRVGEATIWLDKIIHDSSPLGLYAEEYDPILKRHLGNYPQAFTHLGLINSVLNLRQAETFGHENIATTQSERLLKIAKSLLFTQIHPDELTNKSLKQVLKTLFLLRS